MTPAARGVHSGAAEEVGGERVAVEVVLLVEVALAPPKAATPAGGRAHPGGAPRGGGGVGH
eukprot:10222882-Alexandrium_andersonii.AAC.1